MACHIFSRHALYIHQLQYRLWYGILQALQNEQHNRRTKAEYDRPDVNRNAAAYACALAALLEVLYASAGRMCMLLCEDSSCNRSAHGVLRLSSNAGCGSYMRQGFEIPNEVR